MLAEDERLSVLKTLLSVVNSGGVVLITDKKSNIPAFIDVFDKDNCAWTPIFKKAGYLFQRRE
jgi:hypothetical protein